VDLQVFEHDEDILDQALVLEADQLVFMVVCIVVLIDKMIVDKPLLLADGIDDCDRVPTIIHYLQLHLLADPAAHHLLPKVEDGLIQILDIILGLLKDHGAKLLLELSLIPQQLILLGLALPVLIVWTLEIQAVLDAILPESLRRHELQASSSLRI
jgi:hypothetical protein